MTTLRIATADEELGTLPLDGLLEAYPTETKAKPVFFLTEKGEWSPLWPLLEKTRAELRGEGLAKAKGKAAEYLAPVTVGLLQALALVGALLAVVFCMQGAAAKGTVALSSALTTWVLAVLLDLVARIEFNTRR